MEQKKLTKSDLFSMFVRSNLQQASFNFERIHGCTETSPGVL
jgi:PTS system sorbose-specific IID component